MSNAAILEQYLDRFTSGDVAIYDFEVTTPAGDGSVTMAEWSVVRDGRIVSSRLLFDTAAFAALMPQG
jgi:hypothetical protein